MSNYDSISRFDTSSDRFNAYTTGRLKDPEEVLKPQPTRLRDTIETSSEKIEKDVQQRFHANNYQLPNERLAIVAKAGKFVFMALMTPPYLVLYALPRFVATHVLPAISQKLSSGVKRCFQPIEKLVMIFIRRLQRLQNIWKNQKRKIFDAVASMWVLLKKPFTAMLGLWRRNLSLLKEPSLLLKSFLRGLRERGRRHITATSAMLRRVVAKPLQRAGKALLRRLQRVRERLSTTMTKVMTKARAHIKKTLKKWTAPLVNAFNRVKQRAQTLLLTLTDYGLKLRRLALRPFNMLQKGVLPVRSSILRLSATIQRHLKGLWRSALPYLQGVIGAWHSTKKWMAGQSRRLEQKLRERIVKGRALAATIGRALQKTMRQVAARLRPRPIPRQQLLSRFNKAFKRTLQTGRMTMNSLSQRWHRFQQKLPTTAKGRRRLANATRHYYDIVDYKTRRAIYWTRLISAWMRVLSRFWMFSVRRLSLDVVEYCTWRDFKFFVGKYLLSSFKKRFRKVEAREIATP